MKTKKEAACLQQTAEKHKQQTRTYPKAVLLSSLKEQIGELLFLLLAGIKQPDGWQQLDRLLRQFYEGGVL